VHVKSYFAHSVQSAISQAREELGADAVLVSTQRSPQEARALGEYEVVFATELPEVPQPASNPSRAAETEAAPNAALHSVLEEVRDLRRQIMRETASRLAGRPLWMSGHPEIAELYAELMAAEVEPTLALQVVGTAQNRLAASTYSDASQAGQLAPLVREELGRSFAVDDTLGAADAKPRIVALIGPPGAGKTASLVKLAVRYGLCLRKNVHFISIDTLRVAASEQLRSYASVLGSSFQVVDNCLALEQAIEQQRNKEFILIDTPGFTAADLEGGSETSDYLARRDDIQKHLVLPAPMRAADLVRTAKAYDIFGPSRILVTHLDQTRTVGHLFNEAVRSGRPFSFVTNGQRVPDDLAAATTAALVDRIIAPVGTTASEATAA
jgi:flagellar biosynthesis protein FlhF